MAPLESVAVSVMVCVPAVMLVLVKKLPVPIVPSMLDVQDNDTPVSTPSSVSVPVPEKIMV